MSLIKYEGFDEAVVGITVVPESNEFVLYYMIDLEPGNTKPIFITDYIEEVNLEFDFEKKPNLTLVS